MSGVLRRLLLALTLGTALLLGTASAAQAHAELVTSAPAPGQSVDELATLTFDFTEPVQLLPASLQLLDADGEPVNVFPSVRVVGDSVTATFDPPLPAGAYFAVWRVISLDSHPVEGTLPFGVQAPAPGSALETSSGSFGLAALRSAATGAALIATLLLAGALVVRRWALRDSAMADRVIHLVRRPRQVALVATAVLVPVQAALLLDASLWSGLAPSSILTLAGTPVGQSLLLRVLALVAVGTFLVRAQHAAALGAGAAALATFAISGHTRGSETAFTLTSSDLVHLAAGAVWLGGIVVLADALRRRGAPERPRVVADAVGRFSGLAAVSLVAVTLSGAQLADGIVRATGPLGASAYGRALIIKTSIVAVLVAIGAYNRVVLVEAVSRASRPLVAGGATADALPMPRLARTRTATSRDPWGSLRTTLRAEAAAFAVILLVTGALVDLTPPRPSTTASVSTLFDVGGGISAELVGTVDPRSPESLDLRLINAVGQAPRVESVLLEVSQPSRGLLATPWELTEVADGRWQLTADALPLGGEWLAVLTIRVDRFEVIARDIVLTVPVASA